MTAVTEPKNMPIRRAIFHCELCVCGLSPWLSARPSTWLMLAGVHTLRGRPLPAVGRYSRSCQFS